MLTELRLRMLNSRIARFHKLLELRAPANIVETEARLIAKAAVNRDLFEVCRVDELRIGDHVRFVHDGPTFELLNRVPEGEEGTEFIGFTSTYQRMEGKHRDAVNPYIMKHSNAAWDTVLRIFCLATTPEEDEATLRSIVEEENQTNVCFADQNRS
jgi:hypothetical protein